MRFSIVLCGIIAASSVEAQQNAMNLAGTWRLVSQQIIKSNDGHGPIDPKARRSDIIVEQTTDSLMVERRLSDTLGKRLVSAGRVTFRRTGEWKGPYNSPPGSSATTSMRSLENGKALELSLVATRKAADGKEGRSTMKEIWRLNPDGTLRREFHETTPAMARDVVETYTRIERP